ncbi:hypothetical protein PP352_21285 [Mycobacteroides abscessus]|nr:hypothetical protein [Mycobacteroides abscessus]
MVTPGLPQIPGMPELPSPAEGGLALLKKYSSIVAGAIGLFGSGSASTSQPGTVGGRGDAQHSGEAADAAKTAAGELDADIAKLNQMREQLDKISAQMVEDNSGAKQKLLALKDEIDKKIEYAKGTDDTPTKVKAIAQFLKDKSDAVLQILNEAAEKAGQAQANIEGLQLDQPMPGYGPEVGGGGGGGMGPGAVTGPGGGPVPGYGGDFNPNDPYGLLGQQGQGSPLDQLGQAAAGLAGQAGQMASGLGGGGGLPIGDIGSAIAGLAGQARDSSDSRDRDEREERRRQEREEPKPEQPKPEENKPGEPKPDPNQKPGEPKADPNAPAPAPAPPPAPTLVTRPDGTTGQASSDQVAAMSRAVLGGATVDDAAKAAGVTPPPLGAPVKNTVSPAAAMMGDLAVFKDKYVLMLGDQKVWLDGEVKPAAALSTLAGFQAITRLEPATGAAALAAPAVPHPASVAGVAQPPAPAPVTPKV